MAGDLFGSLGGGLGDLFGSIAKSVVPKDTTDGKLINAEAELSSLKKQESEILIEIGRAAFEQNPDGFSQSEKLRLIRSNMAKAQAVLDEAKAAKEAEEAAENAASAALTCPSCSHINPEGTKFCQECGTKLGAPAKTFCTSCGAENAAGTKFCGECGKRLGE
jgi:hypothetical protein